MFNCWQRFGPVLVTDKTDLPTCKVERGQRCSESSHIHIHSKYDLKSDQLPERDLAGFGFQHRFIRFTDQRNRECALGKQRLLDLFKIGSALPRQGEFKL